MSDLIRVSILGSLPGGEKWSVNPVWRLNAAPVSVSVAQLTTIAAAIEALTVPSALDAMWTTSTQIVGVRLEARQNNGTLENLVERTFSSPNAGSASINPHPYQTALVTSLRTPGPGASARGRLYWPTNGVPLSVATLRPGSGDVTAFLGAVKTYLSGIEAAIEATIPDAILAVWSRSLGTTFGVTSLKAGDVLDVQRRRRDALVENYTTVTYP